MKATTSAPMLGSLWVVIAMLAISVHVSAQPRLTTLTWATDKSSRIYTITAQVTSGMTHRLQASISLAANSWIEVGNVLPTGPLLTLNFTNVIATDPPYRFFRLIAESPIAVPVNMAHIPAGSFEMGDAFNEGFTNGGINQEGPVHSVFVSAFYMERHEVTKSLWDTVKAWADKKGYDIENPGSGKATNHPVGNLEWWDAVKWCNARSQMEGRIPAYYTDAGLTTIYKTGRLDPYVSWNAGYRLPTEAEWEKAARGGAGSRRFPWSDGDTITHERANYSSVPDIPYDFSPTRGFHPAYEVGAYPYTSPVGSFPPNDYGMYDMAGNEREWCWDWHGSYSAEPQYDPRGPSTGFVRVIRDGAWHSTAWHCRSAHRNIVPGPEHRSGGFRSVLPSGQP